jgi:hypothetical protein
MKRIIYTAVALITCASVFGIADYYNAKKKGALVNYTDDDQVTTTAVTEKKTDAVTVATKETGLKEKGVKAEVLREEREKEPKRLQQKARKLKTNDQYVTKTDVVVTETKEPVAVKVDPVTTLLQSKGGDGNDSLDLKEEKRSIRMEMFSRAPIRTKKIKKN